tara:strand:+ start:1649 stop:1987 length:339 start_codon:yes stop_codon:yes gene_type:complete
MTNEPKRGTIPYHMYPFYRVYTEKGEQYCDCGWEKHARELVELNRTCSIVADRKNLYYKKINAPILDQVIDTTAKGVDELPGQQGLPKAKERLPFEPLDEMLEPSESVPFKV